MRQLPGPGRLHIMSARVMLNVVRDSVSSPSRRGSPSSSSAPEDDYMLASDGVHPRRKRNYTLASVAAVSVRVPAIFVLSVVSLPILGGAVAGLCVAKGINTLRRSSGDPKPKPKWKRDDYAVYVRGKHGWKRNEYSDEAAESVHDNALAPLASTRAQKAAATIAPKPSTPTKRRSRRSGCMYSCTSRPKWVDEDYAVYTQEGKVVCHPDSSQPLKATV